MFFWLTAKSVYVLVRVLAPLLVTTPLSPRPSYCSTGVDIMGELRFDLAAKPKSPPRVDWSTACWISSSNSPERNDRSETCYFNNGILERKSGLTVSCRPGSSILFGIVLSAIGDSCIRLFFSIEDTRP